MQCTNSTGEQINSIGRHRRIDCRRAVLFIFAEVGEHENSGFGVAPLIAQDAAVASLEARRLAACK